MANNIAVSITADVADLQVKRAIMSAELKAATKDLNAFAKEAASTGSTDALREGMLASAAAAEKAKAGIAQVNAEIKSMSASVAPAVEQMEHGFEGISVSAHEMGLQVRETFAAVGEMREVMLGFGEAMLAAFAVERVAEWGKEMGEAAENVKHLADEFGFSLAQVEKLQGVALGAGVGVDTVARGMALLDKNAATASGKATAVGKALAIVGVSANDGRSQMERLATVADKFQSLSAGPERLALSMALFGKNGREMIPVLELGSKGIEELAAKAEELGMVNENATEKGIKLAEAINTNKIAWEGLKTTLEDAFAETLTQIAEAFDNLIKGMVESYRNGGAVRQIFDAIRVTAGLLGDTLAIVGDVIKTLYENLNTIIPIAGAFASVLIGRYVVGAAAAILSTTELRLAMIGLIGIFEAGGVVEAFTALLAGLAATLRGVAAATLEASAALLASPWTWVAGVVAVAIAMYRDYNAATVEQITATNDLAKAKDTLANTEENLTGKSKDALEAMKAETGVALDLARAHLKTAEAALAAANAEAAVASQRADSFNPSVSSGGGAGLLTATAVGAALAQKQADKAREAYDTQKKAVEDLTESIAKLDKAIASVPDAPKIDLSTAGHEKKPKDDLVQRLEAELTEQKLNWDKLQDQQNTAQAFSLQSEKDFWDKARSITGLSTKDQLAINQKYIEASKALRAQEIAGIMDEFKQQEAAAGKNADARLAVVRRETAYIRDMYGEQSNQYKAAQERETQASQAASQQKIDLAKATQEGIAKLAAMRIAAEEADEKFLVEMGKMTQAELLVAARKHETDLYMIDRSALQQRLDLMKADPNRDPVAFKTLTDHIAQLDLAFQNKLTANEQKGALDRKKIMSQTLQPFSSELSKMLTVQESFATGFRNMWKSLGNVVALAVDHMVEAFLEGLLIQDAASGIQHAKEMLRHAEEAAAGAWKAVVGIPIVGPILAPIAAATAFAGVMAFSAEGGMDRVPYDGATLIAHKDEMVLSAQFANPLRDMLSNRSWALPSGLSGGYGGRAANSITPSATNDGVGGTNITNHFHGPTNKAEIERWFLDHSHGIAKAADKAARNGFKPRSI